MNFDLQHFYRFCRELKVETKELGIQRLGQRLLGSQTYVMEEIAKGLNQGTHFFVILKGRQLGITTISLALDLYWHFKNPGFQGTLTTDTEENRDQFRTTLAMYMDGLPPEYKIPLMTHNRNQMVLKNRSRLFYQVAGLRAKGSLGRGKGITYLHGTETSSWGDEEGLASLLASLAEKNPNRLYLFESTARGFNMWHDMWQVAKKARTQKAIFCGWWRNELYAADPKSDVYRVYWDGKLSPEEKEWTREIKKLYQVEINTRQIAWWRWKLNEGLKDEALMYQEFPPTEDYAFIMTGSSFFSHTRCTDQAKVAKKLLPRYYRFSMGQYFEDTELIQSTERMATLTLWEEPIDNAYYVIGADPAYGSSDWADRFCIQIYRAYADGLDQVAEFATSEINTYQFAWIICYLAGAYKNSTLNLEVNGPGQAVINEMRNLRRQAQTMEPKKARQLDDVLSHMQHYLWRRNDSLGGVSNSLGYLTTHSSKERMLNYFKDYFERGMMNVYSMDLLEEMKSVVRDQGSIAAYGRNKDDRVIATALACVAYAEQLMPRLMQMRMTRARKEEAITPVQEPIMDRQINNYLKALGVGPQ
jgi:Terminase RNaseH-like domain